MTFLETVRAKEPQYVSPDYNGGVCACPRDYDYLACTDDGCPFDLVSADNCTACWNRPCNAADAMLESAT